MNEDTARKRYFIMHLTRLGGAILAAYGMIGIAGKADMGPALAYALLIAGVIVFLIVPRMLAKRWRSPPE